eukprot:XP_014775196.1 PREDICTED: protein fuzzy homolog [Octopus bimaculoides]
MFFVSFLYSLFTLSLDCALPQYAIAFERHMSYRTLSRKERIEILRSFYHQIIGSFFSSTVDQSNTDPSKLSHSATETYITTDTHKCYAVQSLPYQFFVLYNNDIPTYAMRNVTQKTLSMLIKDKSIQI